MRPCASTWSGCRCSMTGAARPWTSTFTASRSAPRGRHRQCARRGLSAASRPTGSRRAGRSHCSGSSRRSTRAPRSARRRRAGAGVPAAARHREHARRHHGRAAALAAFIQQLMDARRQLIHAGSDAGGDPRPARRRRSHAMPPTLLANEPLTDLLRSRVQAEADAGLAADRGWPTAIPRWSSSARRWPASTRCSSAQLARAESEAEASDWRLQRQVQRTRAPR